MIKEFVVDLLWGLPPQVSTVIIAVLPVLELRGAIPIAIGVYKMSLTQAYFWAVVGNIIPTVFLVFFLEGLAKKLSVKSEFFKKIFDWLFDRTRRKARANIEKYGYFGLFILVAIPLPMTGGWTGAMASFLFGLDKKKSILTIIGGIMTAGIIVSLITIGAIKF